MCIRDRANPQNEDALSWATAYYAEGLSLLESIAMPSGKKEELKSFVCHLMNRKV